MKLAIFDLDGTLINSLTDIAEATNYSMRALGFAEHPLSSFNMMVGGGLKALIEHALPDGREDYFEEALEIYNNYYNENYTVKTYVYDGIKKVLEELRQKEILLAVASNKTHHFTENIVKHYFGDELFTVVYGKSDTRPAKPDPAIIHTIIDKLGIDADEAVMIGDSSIDIKTGKNARIRTIGCLWGFRTFNELSKAGADHIVEKPEDILKLLVN